MKPALVTGAAGFIGTRLARALRADGVPVRGLIRPTHDASALEAAGVEVVRADATDLAAVSEAASGCGVIYHLAAARGRHKLSHRAYRTLNLQMATAVARGALAAGEVRLVFASTVALTGRRGTTRQTESTTPRPNSGYRASKLAAERLLEEYGRTAGLDLVIARVPQAVLGPGARDWARRLRTVRDGKVRVIAKGGTIHSGDVDDVVEALRLCGTTPDISGERFLLGAAEPMAVEGILRTAAGELGVPFEPRVAPALPFHAYLTLGDLAYRFARVELPYHYTSEFYAGRFAVDIGHARRRLGFSPKFTIRESVVRTVRWLREEGLL